MHNYILLYILKCNAIFDIIYNIALLDISCIRPKHIIKFNSKLNQL